MSNRFVLPLILLVYLLVGALYAAFTPAWQAPDEPAHYNYVRQIASGGCCPRIESGDWDSAYLDRLKGSAFDPALLGRLESVQYEDHQPPLYYLLLAPLYALTGGSLLALRLAGVLLGAVVVACAYAIALRLAPDRPWSAGGAAALVAFLPQHLHILSSVNNDSLAWALIALTLLGLVRLLYGDPLLPDLPRPWLLGLSAVLGGLIVLALGLALLASPGAPDDQPLLVLLLAAGLAGVGVGLWRLWEYPFDRAVWLLGGLVGLILITKSTGYFLAAVVPLAIALRWLHDREQAAAGLDVGKLAARAAGEALKVEPVRRAGAFLARKGAEALAKSPRLRAAAADAASEAAQAGARGLFRTYRPLLRAWALFLLPALLLGLLWWGRNLTIYGVPDFLGLRAHDAVVVGQLRTEDYAARLGTGAYLAELTGTTFTSFWGQFGWMALPLAGWMLLAVQTITLLIAAGWVRIGWQVSRQKGTPLPREVRNVTIVLGVSGLLSLLAFLYYNTEFVQFQGRYLYAGLIPFALAAAFGLDAWRPLLRRLPRPSLTDAARGWVTMVPLLALAPFALYVLWRVIVPGLG